MKFFYLLCFYFFSFSAFALPPGFVYLHDVAPSIIQDMRYAGNHNFIGRPIKGYEKGQCILTIEAANALAKIQDELIPVGLSLKVYDCYRPEQAVQDFMEWSQNPNDQKMKKEFYPSINKKDVFKLGYVAEKSGHTRGSTVDLTIADLEMGTNHDFLDDSSYPLSTKVNLVARVDRMLLRSLMTKYGFVPSKKEWWHFTLENEPFPKSYFNFPVS